MSGKHPGGRPPRESGSSQERLVARCTREELEAATEAAERAGETVSEFVRVAVELRVKRVLGRKR